METAGFMYYSSFSNVRVPVSFLLHVGFVVKVINFGPKFLCSYLKSSLALSVEWGGGEGVILNILGISDDIFSM